MGMPTKINNQYGFANMELNGGKGSGNFGHSGRPGQIGGSGDGKGGGSSLDDRIADAKKKLSTLQRDKRTGFISDSRPVSDDDKEEARRLGVDPEKIHWEDKGHFWASVSVKLDTEKENIEWGKELDKIGKSGGKKVKQLTDALISCSKEETGAREKLEDALSKLSSKYKRAVEEDRQLSKDYRAGKTSMDSSTFESYIRRIDEDKVKAAESVYKRYKIEDKGYY